MKRMIISTSIALLSAVAVFAQDRPARTAEERSKAQTTRMTEQLGLNEEQQAKVASINSEFAQKLEDLQAGRKEGDMAHKGEGVKLHDARMAALKEVLTPDQYTKLEAMQEKMQDRRMEKRRAEKPGSSEMK